MLTQSEQLLLLELLLKMNLKKADQKIYQSFKFYKTMSKLKEFGLIDCKIQNKDNEKIYFLTFPKGWVRANAISMDKNIPEKYKGLSKDFQVIL